MPVHWLLIDGCIFCINRASVIDNLLLLNSWNNIFVLLVRSSRVSLILWLVRAWFLGPPFERCMVSLRERVVVVMPM